MYQGKRSIFLYKSPPLCFPQKTATLAVLPLFSGQAWPFNINNWAFNSINLLSVLPAKMLVFHWHLSTTGRRLNQTLSPPIDRFVHDQATHKVPAEIFGILQDNLTFLKFILSYILGKLCFVVVFCFLRNFLKQNTIFKPFSYHIFLMFFFFRQLNLNKHQTFESFLLFKDRETDALAKHDNKLIL